MTEIDKEIAPVDANLLERVRALRLGDNLGDGKTKSGSNAWLPWMLCLVMGAAWVGLGSRWYRTAPELAGPAGATTPTAATSNSTPAPTTDTPPAGTASPSENTPTPPVVPTGKSVLVSKGYLIPAHQVSISPIEVSGRITELTIEEGKRFGVGEVLARIEPTSYQADYQEAKSLYDVQKARYAELIKGPRQAEIDQANAELAEAKANLEQSEAEDRRNSTIKNNSITKTERETARAAFLAGKERVRRFEQMIILLTPRQERKDASLAEMGAAEARMNRAKWRLDNCWIRAPISGTILTKKAEIGNLINPVVGGVSTSLCDMADLSDLEVDLEIQERDLVKIKNNYRCEIRAEAYPDRVYQGYVDRQMPIANRARGILPIRVKVVIPATEEQGKFLKPEMGVSVTFYDSPYVAPAKKTPATTAAISTEKPS